MAATGSEIASAYIALTVKAPDIKKQIEGQLGKTPGEQYGKSLGEKFSSGMKKAVVVGAAGIATVLGTALVKGFGRLKEIENAQAKMRGLGFTGAEVTKAMDAALGSVKGTAFGLGEAATVASQMMAAGVKPGSDLEKVLTTVANNAAAAGVGMDEMGSIFSKAATQVNGVQNDVISQLADRGLPIYQALADQMGVTAGEVFKMASNGQVDFATFAAAAESAAGTVAQEMGNTTTGSFDNMMAALGRLGATILEDLYPLIGPLFKNITGWLDEAAVHVEPLVEAFGTWLRDAVDSVRASFEWVKQNSDWIAPIAVAVGSAATAFMLWQGAIKTWTVITNVARAAQFAFNAVMAANPIMLIVMAIAALVAGLVYFFTQTETGKKAWEAFTGFLTDAWANVSSFFQTVWNDYLKPVFEGIGAVLTWVWENVAQPITTAFQVAWAILGGIIVGVYETFIKPMFDALGALFLWIWDTIISPVVDWIGEKIEFMGLVFMVLWLKYIKPAIDKVGAIFAWLRDKVISPVVDWISEKITLFGLVMQLLWLKYVKPALDKIGAAFKWIWDTIISPVVNWIREKLHVMGLGFTLVWGVIRGAWDKISGKIKSGWDTIKGIIDTLVKVIRNDPKKAFEAARDAIGKAWQGIQNLAKKPVKFVIETVINGLIGTINKIPGVNIKKLKLPKGFADGGWTGPGGKYTPAGLVHADEFVVSKAARRRFEANHPGALDHINKTGALPGFAKGGLVHPLPSGRLTAGWLGYPGHRALDFAAAAGTRVRAAGAGTVRMAGWNNQGLGYNVDINHANGLVTRYSHMLANLAVSAGQAVRKAQTIGYVGSTGNSTGPHLHYEVHRGYQNRVNPTPYLGGGGEAGGEGFGILDGLMDWAVGKFKDAFPGSDMWIDAAAGLMRETVSGVVKNVTGFLSHGGPTLYDQGGWLDPGTHLVQNKTGRPEPILTSGQWDTMRAAAEGGTDGPLVAHFYDTDGVLLGTIDGRIERADAAGRRLVRSGGSDRRMR